MFMHNGNIANFHLVGNETMGLNDATLAAIDTIYAPLSPFLFRSSSLACCRLLLLVFVSLFFFLLVALTVVFAFLCYRLGVLVRACVLKVDGVVHLSRGCLFLLGGVNHNRTFFVYTLGAATGPMYSLISKARPTELGVFFLT